MTNNKAARHGGGGQGVEEEPKDIPIIDSHIHLFPAAELDTLAWNSPSNELWAQHAVPEYLSSVNSPVTSKVKHNLMGFMFVETDRKTALCDEEAWRSGPLLELKYVVGLANGMVSPQDGYHPQASKLLLGIVPWAPIPAGPGVLEDYIRRAREIAGGNWHLVKGFRYLVQSSPSGMMLQPDFIAGLKYVAHLGFTFDLGVDFRSGGAWQLDEATEMLERVNQGLEDKEYLKVIINHMCKPPMDRKESALDPSEVMKQWRSKLKNLAAFPNTFVKISGGFSEVEALPRNGLDDEAERQKQMDMTSKKVGEFIDIAADHFGTDRIMFGSDWPVCNIGGGGPNLAWNDWLALVKTWTAKKGLSKEEQEKLFWRTAKRAYNL